MSAPSGPEYSWQSQVAAQSAAHVEALAQIPQFDDVETTDA